MFIIILVIYCYLTIICFEVDLEITLQVPLFSRYTCTMFIYRRRVMKHGIT